jgi:filamentous hemagglutinin family protein
VRPVNRAGGAALGAACCSVLLAWSGRADAQIATDGTVGAAATLTGPNFVIPDTLGARLGANLFHSFGEFSVRTGESATFTTSTAAATRNVISRVTGTTPTTIDGLLRSTIPGADLWLLNPNGVVLGAGASLDVPAGFHVSTANVLELADGGSFRAMNPAASSLTVADPSAFGFLGPAVGTITATGANLAVQPGARLSLVGNSLALTDAGLAAPSGRVDLVSVAGAGRVALAPTADATMAASGVGSYGTISLSDSDLDVGTAGASAAGTIGIVGGVVDVTNNSLVSASTTGAGDGGVIAVAARDFTASFGSALRTDTSGTGDAGRIRIGGTVGADGNVVAATRASIGPNGTVSSSSTATGPSAGGAGQIDITADLLPIGATSFVSASTVDGSRTGPGGTPAGGRIDLRTNDFRLTVGGFLFARTTGAGAGGSISVGVLDPTRTSSFLIREDSEISTTTSATGDAGSISVGSAAAPFSTVTLTPVFATSGPRGLYSESTGLGASAGSPGSISVFADVMAVRGTEISVNTIDGGQASAGGTPGRIDLNVGSLGIVRGNNVRAETTGAGPGGSVNILARDVSLIDGYIQTSSSGSGDAGSVTIGSLAAPVETLEIRDAVRTATPGDFFQGIDSRATGSGDGGDVTVFARSLTMDDDARILADSVGGDGGAITLLVNDLLMQRWSQIAASTAGAGNGGSIAISGLSGAANSVQIVGASDGLTGLEPRLSSASTGSGAAGSVSVRARDMLLDAGASVTVDTINGGGGSIALETDALTLVRGASITGTTRGTGNAGTIDIRGTAGAATVVTLAPGSSLRSDSTFRGANAGSAGDVGIFTSSLTLAPQARITAATADGGGGRIAIRSDSTTLTDASIAVLSSGNGDAGTISIEGTSGAANLLSITGESAGLVSLSDGTGPDAGAAGNISVRSRDISMTAGTIVASTVDGAGGAIDLAVDRLSMTFGQGTLGGRSGAQVIAGTSGAGDAGTVVVRGATATAARDAHLSGSTTRIATSAFAPANATGRAGNGGNVSVTADTLQVTDLASIDSGTNGNGLGGSIALRVGTLDVSGGATVAAVAGGRGAAGNITLRGQDGLRGATSVILDGVGSGIRSDSNSSAADSGAGGSIALDAASLRVRNGAGISAATAGGGRGGAIDLAVGDATFESGGGVTASSVVRPGPAGSVVGGIGDAGDIRIRRLAGTAGAVTVTGPGSALASSSARGDSLAGKAGSISVATDSLAIANGGAVSVTSGGGAGGAIALDATRVSVTTGGVVTGSVTGGGTGGDVTVAATDTLLVDTTGRIVAESTGAGPSGSVAITARAARVDGDGLVSVRASGAGDAGRVTVTADDLVVGNGARVVASTTDGAGGVATFRVNSLTLGTGAEISGETRGSGDAGDIIIQGRSGGAANSVVLGASSRVRSDSLANSGPGGVPAAGSAGSVSVTSRSIALQGGDIIASTIDGAGGSINLATDSLTVSSGGEILAGTTGTGSAGNIRIGGIAPATASSVVVRGAGSAIRSDSTGAGVTAGRSGNIGIAARSVTVAESGAVSVNSVGGAGGSITLAGNDVSVTTGGIVTASVSGAGTGGDISVTAGNGILVSGGGRVVAESTSTGPSGSITLDADLVRLADQGLVSVRSAGTGAAGSVRMNAERLFMSSGSRMDATATSSLAGNLELNVSDVAFLSDSTISGLSADRERDGGNFVIEQPRALVLQRSSILANSAAARGGNVRIVSDAIVLDPQSSVSATGQVLTIGQVLAGVLQLDPPPVVDAASSLDTRCTPRQVADRSSMVVRTTPQGAVRDPYLLASDQPAPRPCAP